MGLSLSSSAFDGADPGLPLVPRERGRQRMRWLDGISNSMDMFEPALGVGDGQGSLVCCSPWGRKELDMTEQLN